jgi:hypothetical protein
MFSLLRAALVIGAIFYFSPVRQGSNETLSLDALVGAAINAPEKIGQTPERLQAAWGALPTSAKQVLLDRIGAPQTSRAGEIRQPPTDTLLPEDHRPAWIAPKKPGA